MRIPSPLAGRVAGPARTAVLLVALAIGIAGAAMVAADPEWTAGWTGAAGMPAGQAAEVDRKTLGNGSPTPGPDTRPASAPGGDAAAAPVDLTAVAAECRQLEAATAPTAATTAATAIPPEVLKRLLQCWQLLAGAPPAAPEQLQACADLISVFDAGGPLPEGADATTVQGCRDLLTTASGPTAAGVNPQLIQYCTDVAALVTAGGPPPPDVDAATAEGCQALLAAASGPAIDPALLQYCADITALDEAGGPLPEGVDATTVQGCAQVLTSTTGSAPAADGTAMAGAGLTEADLATALQGCAALPELLASGQIEEASLPPGTVEQCAELVAAAGPQG